MNLLVLLPLNVMSQFAEMFSFNLTFHFAKCFFFEDLFIYLFLFKGRQRNLPCAGSLPKWRMARAGLVQNQDPVTWSLEPFLCNSPQLGSFSIAFLSILARSWIRSGAAGNPTAAHKGFWRSRQSLNLICHCTSPCKMCFLHPMGRSSGFSLSVWKYGELHWYLNLSQSSMLIETSLAPDAFSFLYVAGYHSLRFHWR